MGKKKNATNQKKRRNKKPYSREKMMSDLLTVDSQLKEYEEAKFLNPERKNSEKTDPVNIIKQLESQYSICSVQRYYSNILRSVVAPDEGYNCGINKQIVHKPVQLSHTSEQELDDLQKMIGTM